MNEGKAPTREQEAVLQAILAALRNIKYGSIQVIIQDGHVVQIEKVEKMRLPQKVPCRS